MARKGGRGGERRREKHGGGRACEVYGVRPPLTPQTRKQDCAALSDRAKPTEGETFAGFTPPQRMLTFSGCDRAGRRKISLFPNVIFFFFTEARSDVAEVEKKTRSDRRDSHTFSIRERV